MSSKKHHSEWLSLVEVSGPFLTMPVLEKVFPQGLDAHDAEAYRELRIAFEEWEEQTHKPAIHRAWLKYVLQQTLGLPDEVLAEGQSIPETLKATDEIHRVTWRPDFIVRNPADIAPAGQPRLLIQTYAPEQDLNKAVAGQAGNAAPATRMMQLLHATDLKLGLVTNGEHWMLVFAPRGETTGFASWYASLWLEEKLTLQAFRSLLGVQRFFNVPDSETLDELLKESAKHQQEVTDQLGYQVRRAVEVLIYSLDRADQDHGRELLVHVTEPVLYESALTVMMRLVFLFCAEERELLLLGDALYDEHYAVSTLVAQLQTAADQHGEEVLERRHDAWVRLLATFRAVYGGVAHERMKLPAYGGKLFDPDRFPFLEGRAARTNWHETPAQPLPVNNRTVLHLLRSLQYLELQGEARRLSFRALDIEQIGHVYEGLLDHTAKRAAVPVLGLVGSKSNEPEITLPKLELEQAKGETAWLSFLKEQTGKSENTLRRLLASELETEQLNRLRAACGNDEALLRRVQPFGALVRNDSFERPVVINTGSVYVTAGTDRRSSGTHYTPRTLTEPIVQYTLEPLVYVGPAEGLPQHEWRLRPPRELLELKICDMACGSGAFLVQACRYLAERLVEAWSVVGSQLPVAGTDAEPTTDNRQPTTELRLTPFGEPATGAPGESLIPQADAERLAYAQRLVAQRCLYGVDKNPLAVEMAKLSLWLLTLAKHKPFTFLDHAIRCGDSLVGIHDLDQIRYFTLDLENKQKAFFTGAIEQATEEVIALRQRIEARPAERVEDAEIQQQLLAEAEAKAARLRYAADLLVAVEFRAGTARQKEDWLNDAAIQANQYHEHHSIEEFKAAAAKALNGQQTFHWPLEFPEVFVERKGFDAIIGNPPFQGGTVASTVLGSLYTSYIQNRFTPWHGKADLVGAFLRQFSFLLRRPGNGGIVATASLIRGETLESSIVPLMSNGGELIRARSPFIWPGSANVTAVCVWLWFAEWLGQKILDDEVVESIGPDLEPGLLLGPKPLTNSCLPGFLGIKLSPSNAGISLTQKLSLPSEGQAALLPAIGGQELYRNTDWMMGPFAFDPDNLTQNILDQCQQALGTYISLSSLKHSAPASGLSELLAQSQMAFACAETTHVQLAFINVPTDGVLLKHSTIIFPQCGWYSFALLQSNFHNTWVWKYGIRRKEDLRYSPKRCAVTFPLPDLGNNFEQVLSIVGEQYHAHRQTIMLARQEGLTKTYNRFHNPEETAADIQRLRALHQQMDEAVAAAYGWTDVALGHDFHATKQGTRFTLSEPARREVLDRLLELNHLRHAAEVAEGLHDKGAKKKSAAGRKKKSASGQSSVVSGQPGESGLRPEQEALFELDDQHKLFK